MSCSQRFFRTQTILTLHCPRSGILVPGGFGLRGTEGMIAAAKWAREKNIPYLGICLGFQIAVIEFCRNVLGLKGASFPGYRLWRRGDLTSR